MALSKIDVANMLTGATPISNGGTGLTSNVSRPNASPIIINGDMAVAQRGTSVTSHNAVSYTTVDRFKTVCETGTYTVIQESLTSGAAYEAGFKNALRLDTTTAEATAGSAGEQTTVEQRIEGFNLQAFKKGTSNAEKYTLAFWVKASKTGSNLQVNLRDVDNTRQIGGTYSISSADTWEHKVINFAADTTGAFGDDNGNSLTIEWFLDGGSNYSGGAVPTAWEASSNADRNVTNFDLAGSTDNDWAITGVQLEVGEYSSTTLPPFQFESFADNFARCARYFFRVAQHGADGLSNQTIGTGYYKNTDQFRVSVYLPVKPRTNPSLVSGSASNAYVIDIQGSTDYVDDFTLTRSNAKIIQVMHNSSDASGTIGEAGEIATDNSSGIIDFDAEL